MSAPAPDRGPPDAGFTLLELLVSLVLVALLMTAMPAALKFAQRAQSSANDLERLSIVDAAATFIEQRLAETTAIYDRGDDGRLRVIFKGGPQSLGFVAPTSFDPANAGLTRIEFKIGVDEKGRSGLFMTWSPWRPPASGDRIDQPAPARTRLIAPGVSSFSLNYFGAATASDQPAWTEAWTRGDAIPDLVEFELSRGNGQAFDARRRTVALRLRLP